MKTAERRMAAGLCRDCGLAPPVPPVARCQPCREKQNARVAKRTAARRAAGEIPMTVWVIS